MRQFRLTVTFEQPPERSIASPDSLFQWLRKRGDSYFSYLNPEGNQEEGAIVSFNGQLCVGSRPSTTCIEDFDDWRDLEALSFEGGCWIFILSRARYTERGALVQLNTLGQLPSDDHRRL